MATHKVIVFGPTGAVGSSAALTAARLGAKVSLAVRDVEKSVPGLDKDEEKELGFERIHADLTKPDTVKDAVTKSGAQFAFIYLAHASSDNMRSTVEALKSAGIELVVFLSSFTVRGDIRAIPSSEFIAFVHARVEVALEEVFGPKGYIALRGGAFASNVMRYKPGLQKGQVKIHNPETQIDNIVPEDIGRVAGTILAKGRQDDESHIYLYGPELISLEEGVRVIGREIGKMPTFTTIDAEEQKQLMIQSGIPPPAAEYMVRVRSKTDPGVLQVFGCVVQKEELANVQKYSGRPPTTYNEWVKQNKHKFIN